MKRIFYILAIAAVLLPSCKTENWVDWRLENELWIENIGNYIPDVITTPSGLKYKIIYEPKSTETTNIHPDDLKSVSILYTGSLIGPLDKNGFVVQRDYFDQNSNPDYWLAVSNLITGFAEGIKKMVPGSHYILYIPYNLGYGAEGTGTEGGSGYIPPYSTLIFDVTLNNVK